MTTTPAVDALRVVIGVATFRRPEHLRELLPLLLEQARDAPQPTSVLVVDNDPEGSARAVTEALAGRVRYVREPEPGIAAARNRVLDEVADADVLVFIDDDERPTPLWLDALLATYRRTGAHGVVGPVHSVFAGELDPWIAAGGFFTRRRLRTGTAVTLAATNNLLLDLAAVRERGLRFDVGLGAIGGEDTLFSRQLTSGGGRLVWCSEAMVHDVVPADRMTRSWVLRRAFRMGGSAARVEFQVAVGRRRQAIARARATTAGLARVAGGLGRMVLGSVGRSQRLRASGARTCARGLGLLAGALGYVYAEYRR